MNTYDKNIENKILDLLQQTEDWYNELVIDTGMAYINEQVGEYPEVKKQIIKSRIFWNWWRSHWQDRDEQFLEECETWHTTTEKYRLVYENHNDARTLAAALYLNGQVLQESYAVLMDRIIKNQKEVA